MAVTGLLIDAARKSVSAVTARVLPDSRTPYPFAHSSLPPLITAMLTPGTLWKATCGKVAQV